MGDYVDFKALKLAVTVEVVAARYGVELRQVNASTARGKCPLPSHPAGDEKDSFSVNVEKRVWICHSAPCAKGRKGKKGGDVIELVAAMEGCSLREAGVKLGSWFAGSGESPMPVDQPVRESAIKKLTDKWIRLGKPAGERDGAPKPPAVPPAEDEGRAERLTAHLDEHTPAPKRVRVEPGIYGVYAPLCAWIEEQLVNEDLEHLERASLYRVLARAQVLGKE